MYAAGSRGLLSICRVSRLFAFHIAQARNGAAYQVSEYAQQYVRIKATTSAGGYFQFGANGTAALFADVSITDI